MDYWYSNMNVSRTPYVIPQSSETPLATFLHPPIHDSSQALASQMMVSLPPKSIVMSYDNTNQQLDMKKRRLTTDQLESLESSFQEEVKLDPDRKVKLARELGLQPRQVAVWFQNRRARWRAKKLEHLYGVLKQEFEAVTMEKHKLQQEVLRLKSILIEQATKGQQVSTGCRETSCEETVESIAIQSSEQHTEGQYLFNVDDRNRTMSPSCWGGFPSSNYP